MVTQVVRLKRSQGEVVQGCDVYIGRAMNMGGWRLQKSVFHNPFKARDLGEQGCVMVYIKHLYTSNLVYRVEELRGKTLGCWCKPNLCHGDVLVAILERSRTISANNGTLVVVPEMSEIIQFFSN